MRPTSTSAWGPPEDPQTSTPAVGVPIGMGTVASTLDLATRVVGGDTARLHLSVGDGRVRTWRATAGTPPLETAGPCRHVTSLPGQVVTVGDARLDPRFAEDADVHGGLSLPRHLSVPMVDRGGRVIGALCVLGREPRSPRREETLALRAVADRVVDEIELLARIRTLEEEQRRQHQLEADLRRSVSTLTQQTSTDDLTGLLNRRAIRRHLDDEVERHLRYGTDLSVAMLDIDHFKRVNDEHGHQAGDEALVAVASVLTGLSRATDLCSRYGGEEFLVVMPGTDRDGAIRSAERLREGVAALDLGFQLTTSIGLATAWGAGTTVAELLEHADGSLYAAKALGRDRVIWASQAQPSPAHAGSTRAG